MIDLAAAGLTEDSWAELGIVALDGVDADEAVCVVGDVSVYSVGTIWCIRVVSFVLLVLECLVLHCCASDRANVFCCSWYVLSWSYVGSVDCLLFV